jgi:hypothetical protein
MAARHSQVQRRLLALSQALRPRLVRRQRGRSQPERHSQSALHSQPSASLHWCCRCQQRQATLAERSWKRAEPQSFC